MGEMYFTLGQLTRENRKNKPECRVNIWNYYTAYLSYPHLQRSNTESAKLNSNTFDHMGVFSPKIWNKSLCKSYKFVTVMMILLLKHAFPSMTVNCWVQLFEDAETS